MSRATELADIIDAGVPFDEGEIANELRRLDRVNAELVEPNSLEAAAKKLAEVLDYPWNYMPEKGRKAMRENAEQVIRAALTSATKETT